MQQQPQSLRKEQVWPPPPPLHSAHLPPAAADYNLLALLSAPRTATKRSSSKWAGEPAGW
jgi:hypothetical protein